MGSHTSTHAHTHTYTHKYTHKHSLSDYPALGRFERSFANAKLPHHSLVTDLVSSLPELAVDEAVESVDLNGSWADEDDVDPDAEYAG